MWTEIIIRRPCRIDDQAPAEPTYLVPEVITRILNIQTDNRETMTRMPMILRELFHSRGVII